MRQLSRSSTMIGVLTVARGVLRRDSCCTTETIAKLLVREVIGVHVAQHQDREQSRLSHRPTPTLTLPRFREGEGKGREGKGRGWAAGLVGATTLQVRPTPERPFSPCVIKTVSQRPEVIAAAAWRIWIMNEQPPTAVPSIGWFRIDDRLRLMNEARAAGNPRTEIPIHHLDRLGSNL